MRDSSRPELDVVGGDGGEELVEHESACEGEIDARHGTPPEGAQAADIEFFEEVDDAEKDVSGSFSKAGIAYVSHRQSSQDSAEEDDFDCVVGEYDAPAAVEKGVHVVQLA